MSSYQYIPCHVLILRSVNHEIRLRGKIELSTHLDFHKYKAVRSEQLSDRGTSNTSDTWSWRSQQKWVSHEIRTKSWLHNIHRASSTNNLYLYQLLQQVSQKGKNFFTAWSNSKYISEKQWPTHPSMKLGHCYITISLDIALLRCIIFT